MDGLFLMRPFFAFTPKSLIIPGYVQGAVIYFVCLSVCLCACVTFVVSLIARAVRGRFPQTRANAWDVFRRTPSRGGRGRRAAVDFVVCFGWGDFFRFYFFSDFFFLRTHVACCKYEAALPHLPLY